MSLTCSMDALEGVKTSPRTLLHALTSSCANFILPDFPSDSESSSFSDDGCGSCPGSSATSPSIYSESHTDSDQCNSTSNTPLPHQFQCQECGDQFKSTKELTRHSRVHSMKRPFSCQECGKRFSRRSHLKVHKRIHSGDKPFECRYCQKRFTQSSNLKAHERTHTGEKPYRCNRCGRCFAVSSSLRSHMQIHQNASQRQRHKCPYCPKSFAWNTNLTKHIRQHAEKGEIDGAFTEQPAPFNSKNDHQQSSIEGLKLSNNTAFEEITPVPAPALHLLPSSHYPGPTMSFNQVGTNFDFTTSSSTSSPESLFNYYP